MGGDSVVKIYVDFHEGGVKRYLERYGCDIVKKKLNVGDFLLSDDVGVERKTTSDFVSSIVSGRLFQQLTHLKENFAKPLLIVEGEFFYDAGGVHENAIRGALASAAMDYGVPIIWSRDKADTAGYLYVIAKREQLGKQEFGVKGIRKPLSGKELQEYLVSSLPGVGRLIAANLLEKFDTVQGVFTAEEKDLRRVDKIGKKKAKKIRDVLTRRYS
jgi:ERCC4-type nuclease